MSEDRQLYYFKSMAQSMSLPNHGLKHIGDMMQWGAMEIDRLRDELEVAKRRIETWENQYGCGPVATS